MKFCVSSYSFGNYMDPSRLGIFGVMDKAKEMGFDAIEFAESKLFINIDEALCEKIKEHAEKIGLEVYGFAVGADFINGCEGNLEAEINRIKRWIDLAYIAGAKILRHDISRGFKGRTYSVGYDDALAIVAKGCLEVTKYAQEKGIETCTENHGYFSQDAVRVEKLINTVAHPNFGALIDMGNFMCADEDPVKSVSIMLPYAKHVHAKDFLYKSGMEINPGEGWFRTRAGNYLRGTIIGHGVANIYQSVGLLKRAGYDRYLTVEFEGTEDNLRGISLGLANLKRFYELN